MKMQIVHPAFYGLSFYLCPLFYSLAMNLEWKSSVDLVHLFLSTRLLQNDASRQRPLPTAPLSAFHLLFLPTLRIHDNMPQPVIIASSPASKNHVIKNPISLVGLSSPTRGPLSVWSFLGRKSQQHQAHPTQPSRVSTRIRHGTHNLGSSIHAISNPYAIPPNTSAPLCISTSY